jgi:NAD(P)-dependent dehydrogenase (short-subunit alcohol dehydrogenase family)
VAGSAPSANTFRPSGFKIALDAIEGLRRQWAVELGPHGIRVVTLKTGGIPESILAGDPQREEIRMASPIM